MTVDVRNVDYKKGDTMTLTQKVRQDENAQKLPWLRA
jgi:hypothetical protein